MKLSYVPGRAWTGRVTFIVPTVAPMRQTIEVRIDFDNVTGFQAGDVRRRRDSAAEDLHRPSQQLATDHRRARSA